MQRANPRASILIIDDDPNVILGLTNILEEDYNVLTADTGRAGISLQRQRPCDVIILDMLMPELDGYQTALEIKSFDPAVPIIVNTGYASSYPFSDVGRRIDPIGYIVKGDVDPGNEALLSTVRSAVRYRRALIGLQTRGAVRATGRRSKLRQVRRHTGTAVGEHQDDFFRRAQFILSEAAYELDIADVKTSVVRAEAILREGLVYTDEPETLCDYLLALLKPGAAQPLQSLNLAALLKRRAESLSGRMLQVAYAQDTREIPEIVAHDRSLDTMLVSIVENLASLSSADGDFAVSLELRAHYDEKNDRVVLEMEATSTRRSDEDVPLTESSDFTLDLLAARLLMAWFGGTLEQQSSLALYFGFKRAERSI